MSSPTKKQKEKWEIIRAIGCIIPKSVVGTEDECKGSTQLHHTGTGMGGRKNHDKVIPLCENHHIGENGIHKIGRKKFRARYGSEDYQLEMVEHYLEFENGN